MKQYNPKTIELKWQRIWEKQGLFQAADGSKKPKFYCLIEFPYPSGAGLHVGHLRSYSALDAIARKKRMQGFNVLYPMGWDAFGLPTENYAIKTGVAPQVATRQNIAVFKKQIKRMGLSFDWSREINTTDPKYYHWTQWIFLQLFKHGLSYQKEMPVNWCPSCKIGLANEEVVAGKCERCGARAQKKILKQWMLKITAYAERLLRDLDKVDYSPRIREQQINWIGRSEGASIKFQITKSKFQIKSKMQNPRDYYLEVFTTRPDTLFGATYMVVCPEHEIIKNKEWRTENKEEVENYIKKATAKSDLERTDLAKEKTGVKLKGINAINPANNKQIPIFVADYVLPHYGTGAIMAVPAHDQRDFEFAQKFKLAIVDVVLNPERRQGAKDLRVRHEAYEGQGTLINSEQFNGISSKKAAVEIIKCLAKKKLAKKSVNYKLRDWLFSRQHYWGESIPIVHCKKCGAVPVPEKDLPVRLPLLKKYQPTGTGESPLAQVQNWVNIKCPKCGGPAKRETDTMPNWAGSSWYFLRYCDPQNYKKLADLKKLKYWLPVDLYNGGMEHTTLHLLYSRFWHKFLYDIGVVPTQEPYAKRRSHGVVLAEDSQKMSKSRGNVINPDEMIKLYGADTLRVYEMFMGQFSQMIPWSTQGMIGVRRFLEKVWKLGSILSNSAGRHVVSREIAASVATRPLCNNNDIMSLLHQTIKKVGEDLEKMRFNTAVSALMILTNKLAEEMESRDKSRLVPTVETQHCRVSTRKALQTLLLLLAPFAPHLAEELWQKLGHKKSIFLEPWPKHNPKLIQQENFELIVQINGRMRDKLLAPQGISQKEAERLALLSEKIKKWLKDKKPEKIIFVKDRLINLVV